MRTIGPIWGASESDYTPAVRRRIDEANLALFVLSTVWFVLHVLIEFRNFIGALFTLTGVYSTAVMMRREPKARTPDQRRLRVVMIALFAGLSLIFITLIFMQQRVMLGVILQHIAESSPIFFMIASIYFENRYEFYDLVVKR